MDKFCFCINEDSQKSGKGKNESYAEVAQAKFFGVDAGEIEQKKQVYETVLEALRTTRVELEAAAFVMVRKTHD